MTKQEFIEKAKKIHGDQYDYSKVELTKSSDKVIIICPKHGEFVQQANSHLQGRGCAKCHGKKFCLEDFIEKAKKVWGDKYDYSEVEYTGSNNKVKIICPEHGPFWQTVSNHLKGQCGCKQCRGKSADFEVIRNFADFKQAAIKKFGNKFDYSKVEWKGSREKICIICPKHGKFYTLPYNFLQAKYGCPKCSIKLKYTTEEYIQECKKNHTIDYDYSQVVYTGCEDKVTIICPTHGEFRMQAGAFKQGGNCLECYIDKLRLGKEEFINRSKIIHGNKYNYDKVNYINYQTKVIITCPKHGDFECYPGNHLKGCECPKCALEHKIPSKGELFIKKFLEEYNVPFIPQFIFKTDKLARNGYEIIVDFFVKYNKKQYFIEYNGRQHYEYVPFFFPTYEDFEKQVRRDEALKDFCEQYKSKVTLVEFKYSDSEEKIVNTLKSMFQIV